MLDLLTNKIFLSVAVACFASQAIKFLYALARERRMDFYKLWESGGMPSAHSAVVSALAFSVYLEQGVSALFVVTLIISIIFVRDALGLRATVEKQASILKKISKEALSLRDFKGHKFLEVATGVILGIFVALLL